MDTTIPITRTKIIIPRRRADLLTRQRLLNHLEELSENRLIIVAAPAGYGKTSLLVDFAHQNSMPVCWLALDNLDQDPQRFIAHFIASISLVFRDFGKTSMSALQSMPQERLNLDALVSLVVNDAYETIDEHFLIVVDDYHLVEENRDINYFINRFLLMVDENCHLVISSRRLLPLPDMPLLVARSEVGGLGFEELAFRLEEIQDLYLQNFKLTISDRDANSLADLTEGWITGLILSTQIVNGRVVTRFQSYPVTGVGLYDYLAQQVLEHQSPELKLFLYRTSILEEFDAQLCEKVIGKSLGIEGDWISLMEEVQRNNLFVLPVVEEKIWLRYHHLFRDFLRNRMMRERSEEARKIQMALAKYYQSVGEWERAYQVYEQIGNNENIARMIESAGPIMVAHGRLLTLQNWLEQLPENVLEKSPALVSLQGAARIMLGDSKAAVELLGRVVHLLKNKPDPTIEAYTYVRRASAYRIMGEYRLSLSDAESALAIANMHGDMGMVLAGAYYAKGLALNFLGNLNEALTWLNRARDTFKEINDEDSMVKVSMEVAIISRYLGKFTVAEEIYREILSYYERTGNIVWQANLLNNLGVLHALSGEYEMALNELERSIQYARMGGYNRLEAYALTSLGDLFKDIHSLKEANESYEKARETIGQINDQFLEFYLLLVASEMSMQRGHLRRAEESLEIAEGVAREVESEYEISLVRLSDGKVAYYRKEYTRALEELLPALEYFVKEGHHVEAVRSRFLVVATYLHLQQVAVAEIHLNWLAPLIASGELQNVIASAGEVLADLLETPLMPEQILARIVGLKRIVERVNKRLPQVRKTLRRQSQIIPLAPPELSIHGLGTIQVSLGDHTITGAEWKAQSARDLLLLLMLHPEGLTKEEIGSYFWPDLSPAELKLRFKNTIYRLRHAAGRDVILFDDETYYFNHTMDYEADFESFKREFQSAIRSPKLDAQLGYYLKAVSYYKGDFLPELNESWALPERQRLHQMYMDALTKISEIYIESGKYSEAHDIVTGGMVYDSTNENLYRLAMRASASVGNLADVVQQYEKCVRELDKELGTEPSSQTTELFKILTR